MARFVIPVEKCDDVDVGEFRAVPAHPAEVAAPITAGVYRMTVIGGPIVWKLGDVALTDDTGSLLVENDTTTVVVRADDTLRLREEPTSTAAGASRVNLVPLNNYEMPGVEPRNGL